VLQNALARLKAQVEAIERGIALLELIDHPQALQVVLESLATWVSALEAVVKRMLSRVPERRVAQVVGQADGLGELLIEGESPRDRPGNLGDLQAMGEPGSVEVSLVVHKDLGLVEQLSKGGGVNDAIAVSLKLRAPWRA
jgi:hypothetical protein